MNVLKFKQKVLSFFGSHSESGIDSFTISYIHNRCQLPNLKNPKNLSEIWIKRVLDGKINELAYLADKYAVREYVINKGLNQILTPLIGVYDDAGQIDFDVLPERFALKANFGAGMNLICTDKSKINIDESRNKIAEWLKPQTYSYTERHYNLFPHRIVCEEFIDDGSGGFPIDYKFMCIHGKVHCILACSGREQGHADYLPYSANWEPMYHYYKKVNKEIQILPKPDNIADMISTAEKLAEGIDLVRVDLYSNGSRIWFGEMTLTPAGCIFHRWSMRALKEMGKIYRQKIEQY